VKQEIPAAFSRYLGSKRSSSLAAGQRLGWRGFAIGAFLSFFLAVGVPYANMIMHATYMAWDFNTPGAIFIFLLLIGVLNVLFKFGGRGLKTSLPLAAIAALAYGLYYGLYAPADLQRPGFLLATFLLACALVNVPLSRHRGLTLNRAELILVYCMLLVTSAVCSMGMSQQLLPIISAFAYYASPQNQWAEKLLPVLPQRLLVDDGDGNRSFYEGGAESIPLAAWAEPLAWWGLFLAALYLVMICAAVILRRQWMERERLAYPLTQVGQAMLDGEGKGMLNGFFRSRAMWYGCAIPLAIGSLKALHGYFPAFPVIQQVWQFSFLGHQTLRLGVSFALVGFSYLINTQIAAGIWVFHLIAKIEREALMVAGISTQQKIVYGVYDLPLMAYQGVGALLVMVLLGLWVARDHLSQVWLKAIGRAPQVEDGDEILSYRAAVAGLAGGTSLMVWWLWIMGTKLWVAALFVVVALLIFIGITRIVAEAGLAALRAPMIAPDLITLGLGSQLVGAAGVVNLSLAYIWSADIRIFVMGLCANGLKLIEGMDQVSRRRIFWGLVLALVLGAFGSCWTVLHLAYQHGGINMVGWFFKGSPAVVYDHAARALEPSGVYWPGWAFFGAGGVGMWLLTVARLRLPWWPIHPLGFPLAANFMMHKVWFSVFLAWLVKIIVMRYGGASVYRHSQRFFLGLIVGESLCNGLWILIDYCTGKMGNIIFTIG
jgi:hypothetical protein